MPWDVLIDDEFAGELADVDPDVRIKLAASVVLLSSVGPGLGRPHVDTLKGSKHANMKELRFKTADGAWRVAFAFDPSRAAILLVGGDKSGVSESRFYRKLIATADRRYETHLKNMAEGN